MSEIFVSIKIDRLDEGGYLATSDELRGLVAQGRTVAETMEIAQDVARKLLESYRDHGDPLPKKLGKALTSRTASTKVKIPVAVAEAR